MRHFQSSDRKKRQKHTGVALKITDEDRRIVGELRDGSFEPAFNSRYLEYCLWAEGLNPGHAPTMAEMALLASERRGRIRKNQTVPGAGSAGHTVRLSTIEAEVLTALHESKTLLAVTEIPAAAGYSKPPVCRALQRLEQLEFAHRPRGTRSGVGITPKGIAALHPTV